MKLNTYKVTITQSFIVEATHADLAESAAAYAMLELWSPDTFSKKIKAIIDPRDVDLHVLPGARDGSDYVLGAFDPDSLD